MTESSPERGGLQGVYADRIGGPVEPRKYQPKQHGMDPIHSLTISISHSYHRLASRMHPSPESTAPPISERLFRAAISVVDGSLAIVPGEHLVVVVDGPATDFGDALVRAVRLFHATAEVFRLEDFGDRPHLSLEPTIREALENANASVMNIAFQAGEFPMRSEFVDLAAFRKLRHAHMVGVSRSSLLAGLVADPTDIARLSRALRVRILPNSILQVRSDRGTDLVVRMEPWCRWYEINGVIQPGTKANLPAGELVSSPGSVDGTYVADGLLADAGGSLSMDLDSRPVTVRFKAGHVIDIAGEDAELVDQLIAQVARTENLDRVGLVSFGTNLGMKTAAEDIFTSQKLPGFHLSLGLSFPQRTGASWNAMDWIAFTTRRCDVEIDGVPVMRNGLYLV